MISASIDRLIRYGNITGLLPEAENTYARNQLLYLLGEDDYEETETPDVKEEDLEDILKELLDFAAEKGLLPADSTTYRDLFDTQLMNCIMPRPKTVQDEFYRLYAEDRKAATDWFYKFSRDTDYIRRYRIKKDMHWETDSPYGPIEISINLSKPEKDPKAIAAAKTMKASSYPKCLLCRENEGYAGRVNHPGRANHRIIPMTLAGADWGFQYSPYVYYNEHCILFNMSHVPMKVERETFNKLLSFVEAMPHYMLGSNADLPIVGGSILSHDHYQGGRHDFPMAKAAIAEEVVIPGAPGVKAGIVNWPLTVIRLSGTDKEAMIDAADRILTAWRGYSDPDFGIFAETENEPHNTITPIARMKDGAFELDLVLRNNRTTEERPLGIFHPRPEYHHIKKENIGLIEVMGLAILPARLKAELAALEECLLAGKDPAEDPALSIHADWAKEIAKKYTLTKENAAGILKQEVGQVFVHVLEDCGVYPATEEGRNGVKKFLKVLE